MPSDFPSGPMQCFGIGVAEFELDVLAVCLDGFWTDAKFFRDLSSAVSSRDEGEDRHLAIAEDIKAERKIATTGELLHGNGSHCSTGVNLARQHSLNRVH